MLALTLTASLALMMGCGDADGDGFRGEEDCDETQAGVHAGAEEICDGLDNDCDGLIDNAPVDGVTYFLDGDRDGYGSDDLSQLACEAPLGFVAESGDCDDLQPLANPGADEVCDGLDNDCDGLLDGDDDSVDRSTASTHWADADLDGYGDPAREVLSCGPFEGVSDNADDCDDEDPAINPETLWYADFDNDGYGQTAYTTQSCEKPTGYGAGADDCDDEDPWVNPGQDELCDGLDNDCDGDIDEPDAADAVDWLLDGDGDGYGVAGTEERGCVAPEGYAELGDDCDDAEPLVNPGASETCDLRDNDCDGVVDHAYQVPGDFDSLQSALDGLPEGEGACVSGGTYYENLDWTRDVTLRGWIDEEVVLDGGYTTSIVTVTGTSDAVLGEMVVQGGQAAWGAGIYVDSGSFRLEGSTLSGLGCISGLSCDGAAVYVKNGGTAVVSGVEVSGVELSHDRSLYGLFHCDDSGSLEIRETQVVDNLIEIDGGYDAFWQGYQTNDCASDLDGFSLSGNIVHATGSLYGWSARGSGAKVDADGWQVSDNLLQTDGSLHAQLLYSSSHTTFNGTHLSMLGNEIWAAGSTYGWVIRGSGSTASVGGSTFVVNNLIVAGNEVLNTNTSASLYGGIYLYGSSMILNNADFVDNSVSSYKSAYTPWFYNSSSSSLTARNVNALNNDFVGTSIARADFYYSAATSAAVDLDYMNFVDNTGGENLLYRSGSWTPAITSYELDPSYTDLGGDAWDWDLQMSSGSPLVDAGDPAILDADGSRSDMGAYGGPEGSSW